MDRSAMRRDERLEISSFVEVELVQEQRWIVVQARDVSKGGLAFVCPFDLPVGTDLRIGERRADTDGLCRGVVKHTRPTASGYLIGVEARGHA